MTYLRRFEMSRETLLTFWECGPFLNDFGQHGYAVIESMLSDEEIQVISPTVKEMMASEREVSFNPGDDPTTIDDKAMEAYLASSYKVSKVELTRVLKILEAHVTEFPQVIDSRGRILRPAPRKKRPGELSGMAVSPGVVTSPVKVLHNPHEKPVHQGTY